MIVAAQVLVGMAAALWWALLVPRIQLRDPAAPKLDELVTPASIAAIGILGVVLAQVLWLLPPTAWWLWVPYLACGLPLVAVDALTTWLPRRLHLAALSALALGLLALAVAEPTAALAALIGAVAGYATLWLVWRLLPGLGFGDVRLAALIGAVGGLGGAMGWALALFLGTLLGALHGVAHAVWAARRPDRPRHFAYGPALWLGPLLAVLVTAA